MDHVGKYSPIYQSLGKRKPGLLVSLPSEYSPADLPASDQMKTDDLSRCGPFLANPDITETTLAICSEPAAFHTLLMRDRIGRIGGTNRIQCSNFGVGWDFLFSAIPILLTLEVEEFCVRTLSRHCSTIQVSAENSWVLSNQEYFTYGDSFDSVFSAI